MSQRLVQEGAGAVAAWLRAAMREAGFSVISDHSDAVQIDHAGLLGERHNIVFERRTKVRAMERMRRGLVAYQGGEVQGSYDSEILQVWVVEAGTSDCAVTVLPDGELAGGLLDALVERFGA